jgi:aminoglycoside 6'-N-acetyltransferase I
VTTVRALQPRDAGIWLRLRQALWPEETPGGHAREVDAFIQGRSREPLAVLVAEDRDGHIAGFAELSIRPYAEGCQTDRIAFLEGWYVEPDARRSGVGRALIRAAEDWGRQQGCTEFASDAVLDNEESAAAHLAVGFTEVERIRCFRKDL